MVPITGRSRVYFRLPQLTRRGFGGGGDSVLTAPHPTSHAALDTATGGRGPRAFGGARR